MSSVQRNRLVVHGPWPWGERKVIGADFILIIRFVPSIVTNNLLVDKFLGIFQNFLFQ
jgi:hypothetical protein